MKEQKIVTLHREYGQFYNFTTYNHLTNSIGGHIADGWIVIYINLDHKKEEGMIIFEREKTNENN